jgi:hypothetical protein
MATAAIELWLDELISAADDVATGALGLPGARVIHRGATSEDQLRGSYLAMVGDRHTVQLGAAVRPEHSVPLARAFLGLNPEDRKLEDAEVVDALGEIVNILAGRLKTKMDGRAPPMAIGLPMVLQGHVELSQQANIAQAVVDWGGIEAELLVYVQAENGTRS